MFALVFARCGGRVVARARARKREREKECVRGMCALEGYVGARVTVGCVHVCMYMCMYVCVCVRARACARVPPLPRAKRLLPLGDSIATDYPLTPSNRMHTKSIRAGDSRLTALECRMTRSAVEGA